MRRNNNNNTPFTTGRAPSQQAQAAMLSMVDGLCAQYALQLDQQLVAFEAQVKRDVHAEIAAAHRDEKRRREDALRVWRPPQQQNTNANNVNNSNGIPANTNYRQGDLVVPAVMHAAVASGSSSTVSNTLPPTTTIIRASAADPSNGDDTMATVLASSSPSNTVHGTHSVSSSSEAVGKRVGAAWDLSHVAQAAQTELRRLHNIFAAATATTAAPTREEGGSVQQADEATTTTTTEAEGVEEGRYCGDEDDGAAPPNTQEDQPARSTADTIGPLSSPKNTTVTSSLSSTRKNELAPFTSSRPSMIVGGQAVHHHLRHHLHAATTATPAGSPIPNDQAQNEHDDNCDHTAVEKQSGLDDASADGAALRDDPSPSSLSQHATSSFMTIVSARKASALEALRRALHEALEVAAATAEQRAGVLIEDDSASTRNAAVGMLRREAEGPPLPLHAEVVLAHVTGGEEAETTLPQQPPTTVIANGDGSSFAGSHAVDAMPVTERAAAAQALLHFFLPATVIAEYTTAASSTVAASATGTSGDVAETNKQEEEDVASNTNGVSQEEEDGSPPSAGPSTIFSMPHRRNTSTYDHDDNDDNKDNTATENENFRSGDNIADGNGGVVSHTTAALSYAPIASDASCTLAALPSSIVASKSSVSVSSTEEEAPVEGNAAAANEENKSEMEDNDDHDHQDLREDLELSLSEKIKRAVANIHNATASPPKSSSPAEKSDAKAAAMTHKRGDDRNNHWKKTSYSHRENAEVDFGNNQSQPLKSRQEQVQEEDVSLYYENIHAPNLLDYFSFRQRQDDIALLATTIDTAVQHLRKERLALVASTVGAAERNARFATLREEEHLIADMERLLAEMRAEALDHEDARAVLLRCANMERSRAQEETAAMDLQLKNASSYLEYLIEREHAALVSLNEQAKTAKNGDTAEGESQSGASGGTANKNHKNGVKTSTASATTSPKNENFTRFAPYCDKRFVWKADVLLQAPRDGRDRQHYLTTILIEKMAAREHAVRRELGSLRQLVSETQRFDEALDATLRCPHCRSPCVDFYVMWPCGHDHCAACTFASQRGGGGGGAAFSSSKHSSSALHKSSALRKNEEDQNKRSGQQQQNLESTGSSPPESPPPADDPSTSQNKQDSSTTTTEKGDRKGDQHGEHGGSRIHPKKTPYFHNMNNNGDENDSDPWAFVCPTCGDTCSESPFPNVALSAIAHRRRIHQIGYGEIQNALQRFDDRSIIIDQNFDAHSFMRYRCIPRAIEYVPHINVILAGGEFTQK